MCSESQSYRIVVWNTAGWSSTASLITATYGSVSNFLDRHDVDILCLQETKLSRERLMEQPSSYAANLNGWQTFWSCCNKVVACGGYSGTATFVRSSKLTATHADCEPFDSFKSLSQQIEEKHENDSSSPNSTCQPENAVVLYYYEKEESASKTANKIVCIKELNGEDFNEIKEAKSKLTVVSNLSWRLVPAIATSTALDGLELNKEGRLIVTFFPNFVILNTYVPTSGRLYSLFSRKIRFLHALRCKLWEIRLNYELPTILVGDLNMFYRPIDVYHGELWMNVRKLWPDPRRSLRNSEVESSFDDEVNVRLYGESLFAKLLRVGPKLESMLKDPMHHAIEAANHGSKTSKKGGSSNEVWKFFLVTAEGKKIRVGRAGESKEELLYDFSLDAIYIEDEYKHRKPFSFFVYGVNPKNSIHKKGENIISKEENDVDSGGKAYECIYSYQADDAAAGRWLIRPEGRISLERLSDCFKALSEPFTFTEKMRLAEVGECPQPPSVLNWAHLILSEDKMIDTFANLNPDLEGRYTAWNQRKNGRYTNEGARIDYIMIDSHLGKRVKVSQKMQEETSVSSIKALEYSLSLATAHGGWKPAPRDGTGLAEAPRHVYDSQFFLTDAKSTSCLVYTPPKYSDHIAVSLRLAAQNSDFDALILNSIDNGSYMRSLNTRTRTSQPHLLRQSSTITEFFRNSSKDSKADYLKGRPEGKAIKSEKMTGSSACDEVLELSPRNKIARHSLGLADSPSPGMLSESCDFEAALAVNAGKLKPSNKSLAKETKNFRGKDSLNSKKNFAVEEAYSSLSLNCKLSDDKCEILPPALHTSKRNSYEKVVGAANSGVNPTTENICGEDFLSEASRTFDVESHNDDRKTFNQLPKATFSSTDDIRFSATALFSLNQNATSSQLGVQDEFCNSFSCATTQWDYEEQSSKRICQSEISDNNALKYKNMAAVESSVLVQPKSFKSFTSSGFAVEAEYSRALASSKMKASTLGSFSDPNKFNKLGSEGLSYNFPPDTEKLQYKRKNIRKSVEQCSQLDIRSFFAKKSE